MRGSDLDEDDVRIRPGKGKSRPRSKDRPDHQTATSALVVAVDRGRYTCAVGTGVKVRLVTAMAARELGHRAVVVGDVVGLVGEHLSARGADGREDLARVVRVEPRRTALRRTADDNDATERVIVANAVLLAIVVAAGEPEPNLRLLDRCLVAAYEGGLQPVLVVTKTDLAPVTVLAEAIDGLDVELLELHRGPAGALVGVDVVAAYLGTSMTVLVGSSGVGKSTLVNALVPSADRATGAVNAVTGRGRHTSSSAVALLTPAGGWVIDTPGVRSFGLAHVSPAGVLAGFADLAAAAEQCPRGCEHRSAAEGCELDAECAARGINPRRLDSFRRLLSAREADPASAREADPAQLPAGNRPVQTESEPV